MDFEKMREVISETVGCDLEKVTREAKLEEDLGADSLAAMELVMALEEAFEVEIDDAELDQFKTVGDLADYVEGKLA
ncbi:acyl carrier protein [Collinsella sp. An307]|uniref:acyl carrier protein n=1 Tax=Collinsella sp. An307 TaxID=1965630 RepID=UPI000B36572F|nr:acyl carrier protein [Collinsella sp. An307]OUO19245.1 acyl carrier protein [Collinsella sp. An307]